MISLEWLKLEPHAGRLYQILAYGDKPSQKLRGQGHMTRFF